MSGDRAREWLATYVCDAGLRSRVYVYAVDEDTARRLAANVFEQVYKRTPASMGWELVNVEPSAKERQAL